MTTILIMGPTPLELPHVPDQTDMIIPWHVRAVGARFQWEMEARVFDTKTASLKNDPDFNQYVNRVKALNEKHKYWSIHDSRPLWFMDEFVKIAGEVKIIWVDQKPENDYERQLQKRIRAAFDKFDGQKLHLQEVNSEAAYDFVIGKTVWKQKRQQVSDDGNGERD